MISTAPNKAIPTYKLITESHVQGVIWVSTVIVGVVTVFVGGVVCKARVMNKQ